MLGFIIILHYSEKNILSIYILQVESICTYFKKDNRRRSNEEVVCCVVRDRIIIILSTCCYLYIYINYNNIINIIYKQNE